MSETSFIPSADGSGPASMSPAPVTNSQSTDRHDVRFDRIGSMSVKNGHALFFIKGHEYYASRNEVRWIATNLMQETNVYTNKLPQMVLFGEQSSRLVGKIVGTYSRKSMRITLPAGTFFINVAKALEVIAGNEQSCQISEMVKLKTMG